MFGIHSGFTGIWAFQIGDRPSFLVNLGPKLRVQARVQSRHAHHLSVPKKGGGSSPSIALQGSPVCDRLFIGLHNILSSSKANARQLDPFAATRHCQT